MSELAPGFLSDMRMLSQSILEGKHVYQFQEDKDINKEKMTEFHIHRFLPEDPNTPAFVQSYWIDLSQCGPMVLDVLIKIKNEIDPTLTFRRSCREGICGSCAMHINGINSLSCITPVIPSQKMTVGPLVRLPIIKDLVVDMSNFYNQYKSIDPWLKRKTPKQPGQKEYYMSQEDRKKLDGLYECVLCACCSTLCPSYWWNQQAYLGPAVLMQAYRWAIDSRDEYTDERLATFTGEFELKKCYQIGSCTATCPKGLNPRDALKYLKEMVSDYEKRKADWQV
jgi:succinate dehydrogenase (ubiquinone) iron-sulfur subunit